MMSSFPLTRLGKVKMSCSVSFGVTSENYGFAIYYLNERRQVKLCNFSELFIKWKYLTKLSGLNDYVLCPPSL